ncbi:hypothetical protein EMN47_14820 [Prolixibacteraceae bacterium JC049]|nr:hypothetical protein [Prolixibacteraceae bacterium JC049]
MKDMLYLGKYLGAMISLVAYIMKFGGLLASSNFWSSNYDVIILIGFYLFFFINEKKKDKNLQQQKYFIFTVVTLILLLVKWIFNYPEKDSLVFFHMYVILFSIGFFYTGSIRRLFKR